MGTSVSQAGCVVLGRWSVGRWSVGGTLSVIYLFS